MIQHEDQPTLGVGMVGYAFMGAAHSRGWRDAPRVFSLPLRPVMAAVCGRDAAKVREAAERQGWAAAVTDWRSLLLRDDVQLIDVCTPGDSHAEISIAALDAGRHVLCEKPLANSVAEAEAMAAAARRAAARGVRAMIGFNYRRVPALALARQLVVSRPDRHDPSPARQLPAGLAGRPGVPADLAAAGRAGRLGALGDLGAHIVDLAQYLTGELITGVSAMTTTFITERPLPGGQPGSGPVTVDDAAVFTARLGPGALATFEATRFAAGRKNALRIELNGDRGSLAFDLERLNELEFHDQSEDAAVAGFRRILVTGPAHPYLSAWWPPGHVLGWEHTFVHEVADLVTAIAAGADPEPSFADGLQVQRVLAAVADSAEHDSRWTPVPAPAGKQNENHGSH